jgi:hypothetical protein
MFKVSHLQNNQYAYHIIHFEHSNYNHKVDNVPFVAIALNQ